MSLEWMAVLMVVVLLFVVATSLVAWLAMSGMLRSARARDERLEVLHQEVDQLRRALPDLSGPRQVAAAPSRSARRSRRTRRRSWWQGLFGIR